jgi:TonB family protein
VSVIRIAAALCALALLLSARAGGAQPPAGSVAPQLRGDAEVLYPEGASGDAVVVIEVLVDAGGGVTQVSVVSGTEPFASAATRAAGRWRFEPATKDGRPVAARLRLELSFREPPPEPEPEPESESEVAPATELEPRPGPARAEVREKIEVTVIGERAAPSRSLTRAEVRELPGTFGDPFRAVEAMPGVTPILSGVPFFFVRGAPPGNVGYFLDGIRVPLLYHIGLGPSVVHPAIVERVDLHPGGYPARFGRFAGGIVAAETTPPRHELHGEASLRLVDAGLLLEAPVADHRVSVLAGGRYSYTALALSLLSPEVVLEYWDYQLRTSWDVGRRDTLTLFSFGAFDYLGEKREDGRVKTLFSTEFHRFDLRWDHAAARDTDLRLAATVGMDRTRGEEGEFFVRNRMSSFRSELRHRASRQALVRGGTDVAFDHFDLELGPPRSFDGGEDEDRDLVAELFPERTDVAIGAWADVVWQPARDVTVTPGLRVDYYASQGNSAVGVDPRIAARLGVTERWRLIHALGVAHQPPSFVLPVPGFQIGGLKGGLQRSVQASSGVEGDFPAGFISSVTLFYNAFFRMTDALGTTDRIADDRDEGDDADALTRRSLGSSVGLELWIRRPLTRRLGGFLAYTLSRSMRSVGREKFPSSFDRSHVLNAALAYDLGKRWRAGSRFMLYTGFPAQIEDPRSRSPERIPAFWRVDLRLEKRWRIGERGSLALVFELLNATLNKEVVEVDCYDGRCENEEIGPVTIPSIGLEAVF